MIGVIDSDACRIRGSRDAVCEREVEGVGWIRCRGGSYVGSARAYECLPSA